MTAILTYLEKMLYICERNEENVMMQDQSQMNTQHDFILGQDLQRVKTLRPVYLCWYVVFHY
jgi:hypothetical protein